MKAWCLAIASLLLVSCQTKPVPEPIIVIDDKPKVKAPSVDGVAVKDVQWKVYDKKSLEQHLSENGDDDTLYFVLDEENFKVLNLNLADVLNYIKQQNEVVIFYEKSYTE